MNPTVGDYHLTKEGQFLVYTNDGWTKMVLPDMAINMLKRYLLAVSKLLSKKCGKSLAEIISNKDFREEFEKANKLVNQKLEPNNENSKEVETSMILEEYFDLPKGMKELIWQK